MHFEIRQAALTDLELLVKWRMEVLREVFSIPADQPLARLEQENRTYYQNALSKAEHMACLAYSAEKSIGCGGVCFYREMPSPDNQTGVCAYLMNIYTRPAFRGHGIGKRIVSWLIKQAKDREITKIYLETSACGRPLYQKMGFCDMHGYMQLKGQEGRGKKPAEKEV